LPVMTPNNTLERTMNHGGRIVLAMDCVLADGSRGRPLNSVVRRQSARP
jgi:hypothetical protein